MNRVEVAELIAGPGAPGDWRKCAAALGPFTPTRLDMVAMWALERDTAARQAIELLAWALPWIEDERVTTDGRVLLAPDDAATLIEARALVGLHRED